MLRINILILSMLLLTSSLKAAPMFKSDKAEKYEEDHTTWVYPPWKHTWGVVRATQTHLTFFTMGKAEFINPQGLAAVKLMSTDDPETKSDDDEVTVYGINTGENSIIYNRSMQSIGLYGYDQTGEQALSEPWDVAALPNGLVFVTDAGNHRVVKFRNVNADLVYEGSFGADSTVSLVLPRGVAVTGGGKVVVADAGSNSVVIFDTAGVFLNRLTGFIKPVGIEAVDGETSFQRPHDEYIVVSDSLGKRLRKVLFNGYRIAETDVSALPGLEDVYMGHLTTDLYHNVAVTDSVGCRILKFDPKLKLLAEWGQEGRGRSRFEHPTGIAIWRRYGQTFIAEKGGAHYLWVGVDVSESPDLEVDQERGIIRLGMILTERARMELELLKDGDLVRKTSTYQGPGKCQYNWKPSRFPLIRKGKPVTPTEPLEAGEYTLRIHLRASYSSRKVFERVFETVINFPGE